MFNQHSVFGTLWELYFCCVSTSYSRWAWGSLFPLGFLPSLILVECLWHRFLIPGRIPFLSPSGQSQKAMKETQGTDPNRDNQLLASSLLHPPPNSWGKRHCCIYTASYPDNCTFHVYLRYLRLSWKTLHGECKWLWAGWGDVFVLHQFILKPELHGNWGCCCDCFFNQPTFFWNYCRLRWVPER